MGLAVGSMTLAELSEAIPPAYARFVAENFFRRSNAKIDSNQLEWQDDLQWGAACRDRPV
jgi:hypothetical protein